MKNNRQRNLTKILFAVYFLILVWILLFKMSFSLYELYKNRSINLIPFMGSVVVNGRIYINEIIDGSFLADAGAGLSSEEVRSGW